MINKKIKDERVIAQQRKIASEAFQLVYFFLIFSMLYKQFILNEPFSSYLTEFIAFFGSAFYILIRNTMKGNDIVNTKNHRLKIYLMNSLITSITITILIGITNYNKYPQNQENLFFFSLQLVIMFVGAFAIAFSCFMGAGWLSKKYADKLAKQYDDDSN